MAKACQQLGVDASACAGFSLGELAALFVAGAFSFEEAFQLVCHRAHLMSRNASENPGVMYAVLGLDDYVVEAICKSIGNCYPVNYNCPGQIVVACAENCADMFLTEIKSVNGKARKLAVSYLSYYEKNDTSYHTKKVADVHRCFSGRTLQTFSMHVSIL